MKKNAALCFAFMVALGVFGAVYEGIETDVSALPADKAFIGRLVRSRVWDRIMPKTYETNANLKVSFVIDASLGGENAVVTVKDGKAVVRGARFRALVAGAGVMMRSMRFSENGFSLDDGEYRFAPRTKFRQVYFARHYENWYNRASTDEVVRYFEDMMLWGMNALHDPLAFPVVNAKSDEGERAAFLATSKALSLRVDQFDVDLTIAGGGNLGPRNMPAKYRSQCHYKGKGSTAFNVCPERPGALKYLLDIRRDHNRQCKGYNITGCRYMPYDEGGCRCEKCYPWGGNGYIRLIEKLRDMNEELNPNMKHIVSTWFFDKDDWKAFYAYLEKQDWIDYIMVGGAGGNAVGGVIPKYIVEHPVPKNIPVITFPEISMYGRFPWGGTAANPLPARFEEQCRISAKAGVMGFQLYSEGIYEDLNKIIINALSIDPERTAASVLAEYANWEFPGADPADFVPFVNMLEDIYSTRIKGRTGLGAVCVFIYLRDADKAELDRRAAVAAKALALAKKMDGDILPRCRHNWRWRLLYLRAVIDESIYRTRDIRNPEAVAAYAELMDIYHGQRQSIGLYEGLWGGFTLPPMMEAKRFRDAAEEFLKKETK